MQCGQYKLTPQSFMHILAATFVQTIILYWPKSWSLSNK